MQNTILGAGVRLVGCGGVSGVWWCIDLPSYLVCRELSFGKGDIIDLLHTVDEHWLEGRVGTREGILPTNYVKVSLY